MKNNKNIIYKSLFSNDIYINEYLLNEKKIKSYEITYSNFFGKKENIKIEDFSDFSLNRLINYGTLDYKNDEITLKAEFVDKTNYFEKIKGNYWGLNIEKIYPNQIRGWLIFKKNLILRPFYLRINNQEIAYSIKILGERDDVSNAFNLKDGIAKEFELRLASKIVNDFSSIELFYKNINKDSVFYKNKFSLFSWKNNLKCNFLENYENKKIKNIAILMPIYDGVEETIIAINSVLSGLKKQNYYNYRFILGLDNPSNLKMKDEILNKFSHNSLFTIIINEENKGFIGNCNNLFSKISVFEDILLLNSDIEAPKSFDWIQKLIDTAESDNKIGTVTPMSNAASIFSFPNPNEYQGRFKNKTIEQINDLFADNTEIIEVPSCHGFCTLIVNTRLKLNYLFDEMFGKGYGEENDLSMRINNIGYKNVSCSSVYIYHHESISFSEKKEEFI